MAPSVSALNPGAVTVDSDFVALSRNKSAWEDSAPSHNSSFSLWFLPSFLSKSSSLTAADEFQSIMLNACKLQLTC